MIQEKTKLLNRLLNESWMYNNRLDVVATFYKKNWEDLLDVNLSVDDRDKFEEIIEEKVEDIIDANPIQCLIVYLYEKKILTDKHIKEFYGGKTFGNSCFGDWRKKVEKIWGIKFK